MTIVPFLNKVNDLILNPIIMLLFAISFVYFVYGIITFIRLEPGDAKKTEARNAIIWGIVGMVIMFSVYGILTFIFDTFGIKNDEVKNYLPFK
jgi:phosphotransferase system  glucose/maltose/N-acetylglucosamine-specific IIC component